MKVDAPTHEEREKAWCKERQHWPWWADVPQNANVTIIGEHEGRLTRAEKRAWSYGYHVNQGAGDLGKFPERTPRQAAIRDIDKMSYRDRIRLAFIRLNGHVACEKNVFSHKGAYVNSGRDFLDLKRDRHYKTVDGKTHRVMCSISDRERGYISEFGDLPWQLSYPMVCLHTFDILPHINNPPSPESIAENELVVLFDTYSDQELVNLFTKFNNEGRGHRKLPTSTKTIKRIRGLPNRPKSIPGSPTNNDFIPPYAYEVYAGTPIGDLLKAEPTPGRAALAGLHKFFIGFLLNLWRVNELDRLQKYEPTRENISRIFRRIVSLGTKPAKEDQAGKYFRLLTKEYGFGIIKSIERSKYRELYYITSKRAATARYGYNTARYLEANK